MLEYYKEQYPIEEKQVGNWIYKDCPKRTEKYYKKLTVDEKMFYILTVTFEMEIYYFL